MVHCQRLSIQVQLCYQGILLSTLLSLFLTWIVIYYKLVNSLRKRGVLLIFPPFTVNFKIWIQGRRLAMLRNALASTSLRSTTIHKNNLKWQLVVILFRSHVNIMIMQLCCGTIAWVILMLCISSIYFLHYLIKIQNSLSVKSVNYQSKSGLIFPFNTIKRLCKTRENSNFLKKGKIVISAENPEFF